MLFSPSHSLSLSFPFSQSESKCVTESSGAWQIRFLLKRSPGSPATERETFCFHYSCAAGVHRPTATPNGHNTLRWCSGGMHGSLRRGVVPNTSHCTAQIERYTTAQRPDCMFLLKRKKPVTIREGYRMFIISLCQSWFWLHPPRQHLPPQMWASSSCTTSKPLALTQDTFNIYYLTQNLPLEKKDFCRIKAWYGGVKAQWFWMDVPLWSSE